MFLFASPFLNYGLTVLLVVLYVVIFIVINKYINKHQDSGKKGLIYLYLLLFIILFVFVGLVMWFFGYDVWMELENLWQAIETGIVDKIGAIIGTVITVFAVMMILKVVNILVKKAISKPGAMQKRITTIMKLVKSIITYTVDIVAVIVILSLWGVNVLPALAGLGIMGLVIGLGAQSLIKDFISGFFIIFEHHFDVGDIVEINGFKGEVIDIGLKTTRIKNWKQDIKIIANGTINDLLNYSKSESVAIIKFGIAYKEDIQKTIDLLNQELPKFKDKYPEIIENPTVLGVSDLADSSVNITVICKTMTEKHYGIERAIRQGIKEILDQNNIEIPFPQMVLHKAE